MKDHLITRLKILQISIAGNINDFVQSSRRTRGTACIVNRLGNGSIVDTLVVEDNGLVVKQNMEAFFAVVVDGDSWAVAVEGEVLNDFPVGAPFLIIGFATVQNQLLVSQENVKESLTTSANLQYGILAIFEVLITKTSGLEGNEVIGQNLNWSLVSPLEIWVISRGMLETG